MTAGIPKIIHQTSGNKVLPDVVQEQIARFRSLNPGWEYRYYNDAAVEDYILQNFPEHYPVLRSINPRYGAAKADLFRYLLMYREGGVYLDIKSTFTRPLDEVLRPDDRYLLSHWSNTSSSRYKQWGTYDEIANPRGEFLQCFIICTPKHAFLEAVVERVTKNLTHYDRTRDGVGKRLVHVTGPVAYTLAITPLLQTQEFRLVNSEDDLSFIYNFYRGGSYNSHMALFDHHYRTLGEAIVKDGVDPAKQP
jgi:mannosyltransferase OCH1-like enzyme